MRGREQCKLLIVEDDAGLQDQLRWCLDGYEVLQAQDRASAMELVRRCRPALVSLDLGLPPDPANASEGLALLDEILVEAPQTKVVVVTGNGERENALRAVARGAYDFYVKPVDADLLRHILDRAARLYALEEENRRLSARIGAGLDGVITGDPGMLRVCRTIERIAPAEATVLLLGESGTGKEVLARALHQHSTRHAARMVAINCAAIPENLLESELFGYERGAFTGATRQTPGRIECADGGTLFLDEIGDLPLSLQAKMLRFLQGRTVERLGGRTEIPVDVRVICATHQDLVGMIRAGTFREDLYYRIAELDVTIPPLRERIGDAALLAHTLLERFAREHRKRIRGFTAEALTALEAHPWPGNVRELENVIRRAVILSDGARIDSEALGLDEGMAADDHGLRLRAVRDEAEQQALARALGRCNGNIAQAAGVLGITRPTLYSLLDKYGLR
ncbi:MULTISPECIES: PEP-CTERM-box response regulator transcription factor [Halorhodospira]|uniref:PEP-CTERM-box response regulator transcription factor n=1 Tax=Halorhodospira TaxID=85108 RepID=UPI001912F26F|nr:MULTISPECIES: PEP-CTERM-box response regulator transcription factor [Halorhodospira]MBK5936130.1 PEP-CTERM-box response regulator transcription factor [Halorhodospira halophila]MCG5537264.1 PEP-CTERM-box response regulator transcription factor [Halorhodospira sp. 9622]MCG5540172.1 PEP-CTERM-box response regulator transcription factor [Halorhodospira sp. M39old]MCG5545127.1 PEP-CTERM-box response regulator transcription factor [Halorhodospira sp. M38]